MMSTGEVACFGVDHFDAYLKALLSVGHQLPKKTIFLSIGPYIAKQKLLTAVRALKELGFQLYGSVGTADFYTFHNINIHTIDWKSEQTGGITKNDNGYIGSSDSLTDENNPQTTIADYFANGSFDLVGLYMHL